MLDRSGGLFRADRDHAAKSKRQHMIRIVPNNFRTYPVRFRQPVGVEMLHGDVVRVGQAGVTLFSAPRSDPTPSSAARCSVASPPMLPTAATAARLNPAPRASWRI